MKITALIGVLAYNIGIGIAWAYLFLIGMEIRAVRPDILTVTRNGYGKRTEVDEYRLQGRGGSGVINMRVTERNGEESTPVPETPTFDLPAL